MAKTIVIDIRTTASAAGITSIITQLNRLKTTLNSLNKSADVFRNFNKAISPLGSNTKRAADGMNNLGTAAKNLHNNLAGVGNNFTQFATGANAAATAANRVNNAMKQGAAGTTAVNNATKQTATGFKAIAQAFAQAAASTSKFNNQMAAVTAPITRVLSTITKLGSVLMGAVRSAFTAVSNAARSFANSAGSMFSGLQRAIQSVGGAFQKFGSIVTGSMSGATRSIREFYNAGWSLLTTGYLARNFGQNLMGSMSSMFTQYMDYERDLVRASIAASSDMSVIQDMIFGLQRGRFMQDQQGRPLPIMGMTADELAQGSYYYASAIGQQITPENISQLGPVIANILAMASATQTGVQTAIKGVLNIAQEFGIDPRDVQNTGKEMSNIAAQIGYLANISSMEVPDIVETFKMLGPMAHILTDRNTPGAGLEESMMLAFMASEVGLRGSRVGSGVNQALTTLLDPSDKAIESASRAFGIEASKQAWDAFFFDGEGRLKGGLPGFFDKIAKLPDASAASFLAEIFTTNATRNLVGIEQAIRQHGGIQKMMEDISGDNPMRWLSEAITKTNDTIFANFQNLKNAWFSVQAAIVTSISGPVKAALKVLSDAFWEVGDAITKNPWIAKFVAGIVMITGAIATLVGTIFMVGGSLLLLMKAFSMLGTMAHPLVLFVMTMIHAFTIFAPVILLVAAAVTALYAVWTSNFMGIQDSFNEFRESFSFAEDIVPILNDIGTAVIHLAAAWKEFIAGIILGFGPMDNLRALIHQVFGDLAGPYVMGALLHLRDAIAPIRTAVIEFFATLGEGSTQLRDIAMAIQGFVEHLITGQVQMSNLLAQTKIGEALGIKNLPVMLANASSAIRDFTDVALRNLLAFGEVLFDYFGMIGDNLGAIFSKNNILTAISAFSALIGGVFKGFSQTVLLAVSVVERLTAALADAGQAGEKLSNGLKKLGPIGEFLDGYLQKLRDLGISVEDIAGRIGTVIGTALGVRLVLALTPGLGLVTTLAQAFFQLGVGIGQAVGSMALFLIRIAATTLALGLQLGSIVAVTAAKAAWIIVTEAAAAAQLVLAVAEGVATAAAGPLAVALAAVELVLIAIPVLIGAWAVAAIAAAGASDGWSGALNALIQEITGFGQGLFFVLNIVYQVVSVIGQAVGAFLSFIGVANEAHAIGVALGVVVGLLIVGFTGFALTLATVATAAILSLTVAISGLILSLGLMGAPIAAAIFGLYKLGQIILTIPLAAEAVDKLTGIVHKLGDAWGYVEDKASSALDKIKSVIPGGNDKKNEALGSAVPVLKPEDQSFLDQMKDYGNQLANAIGLDPSKIQKQYQDALAGITLPTISPATTGLGVYTTKEMQDYIDQSTAYNSYEKLVEKMGKVRADAFYIANEQPIPTEPLFDPTGAQQGVAEGEQLAKDITEMNKELSDAMKSATLPEVMQGIFGKGSVGDALMQVGEQIIQNVGDRAPWLNMTELLADAAGTGMLGADVSGQNIQKALRPALEIVAEQTGMSINDIMKDIPKYIVPDEFVPMATGELMQGLGTIPKELYTRLDKLGAGEYTDFGLDWAELTNYAIGQGIAGHKWNLANYLASSWDISLEDASNYLKDHGINANVITDQWFDDTQLLIDSMGGDISVMTEDWMNYLGQVTNNFTDKTIEITRSAFDALPDAVKIGFTKLGYSFVIGGEQTMDQITTNAKMVRDRIAESYDFKGIFGTAGIYSEIQEGTIKVTEFTDELGNAWVTLSDALGHQITIPAVEYQAYMDSVAAVKQANDALERQAKIYNHLREILFGGSDQQGRPASGDAGGDVIRGQEGAEARYAQGGAAAPAMTTDQIMGMLGLPPVADMQTAATEAGNTVRTAMTTAFTTGDVTPDYTVFKTLATGAATAFGDQLKTDIPAAINGSMTQGYVPAGVSIAGPYDGLFQGYAISAATAFKNQFNTSMSNFPDSTGGGEGGGAVAGTAFDGIYRGYGISAAIAFKESFTGFFTGEQELKAKVTVERDITSYNELVTALNEFNGHTFTATAKVDRDIVAYNELLTSLNEYNGHVYIAYANVDGTDAVTDLSLVQGMADNFDGSYTAYLYAVDYASVTISNALNALAAFDGTNATATMTTVNQSVGPGYTQYATGGFVDSPLQLVGERGPELAALPQGTHVKSTAQTMNMLRDALSSAIQPRDFASAMASSEFRSARQWEVQGRSGGGDVNIEINNLNIAKEVDIESAFEKIDRLSGRKMELARRGMGTFEESRTL